MPVGAFARYWLGIAFEKSGNYAAAQTTLEEGLAIGSASNSRRAIAHIGSMLGRLHYTMGNYATAHTYYLESLKRLYDLSDRWGEALVLNGLVLVLMARGQSEQAVCLSGAVAALRNTLRASLPPSEREEYERHIAGLQDMLSPATFTAARAQGERMTREQTIAYALATT